MRYANLSTKKIAGMGAITLMLLLCVSGTVTVWAHAIGTFSIPGVELTLQNGIAMWADRIQFNSQFGSRSNVGANALLAFIGMTPPASSEAAISSSTNQTIPVFLYHGITPVSANPDETSISTFKSQMFALKNAGWQTVSIEDFVAAMQGKKTLPPKSFLLTFDDGRQDAYYNATPILQALGYQAVMYVITGHSLATGNLKSKYYVTQDQLQEMLASGVWELQSHSDIGHAQYPINATGAVGDFFGNELWIPKQNVGESSSSYASRVYTDLATYFDTGTVWKLADGRQETTQEYEARIGTDLANAKNTLSSKLNVNAISFAYPYNDFAQDLKNDTVAGPDGSTPVLVNFVNQLYDVSFYQWYPSLGFSENYPNVDGQLLKRIEPQPNWTPDYILSLLSAGQAKTLPYNLNTPTSNLDWTAAWGTVSQSPNSIALAASASTAGASTILDGSRLWTNYDYEATLNWQNANSISLFGHYAANPLAINYLACNFSNGSVQLENHDGETTSVIAQKNNSGIGPGTNKKLGIQIAGNYAECLWNGAVITGGQIPSSAPKSGGVGIEIWNPTKDSATATLTDVSVQ